MYCAKCGKEMPDGEMKVCEECEKAVVEEIMAEEKTNVKKEKKKKEPKKEKKGEWEVSKKKEKKGLLKKVVLCVLTILCIALVIFGISKIGIYYFYNT